MQLFICNTLAQRSCAIFVSRDRALINPFWSYEYFQTTNITLLRWVAEFLDRSQVFSLSMALNVRSAVARHGLLDTCTCTWVLLEYIFQVLVLVLGHWVLVLGQWVLDPMSTKYHNNVFCFFLSYNEMIAVLSFINLCNAVNDNYFS